MRNVALRIFLFLGCAFFLASCGGGGEDASNPDNAILYSSCGNSPNYAAELGSYRMLRWKQFPLKVHIYASTAPMASQGNNREIYERAIQAGALKWDVGNGIGTLKFVTEGDADIEIRFTDTLPYGTLGKTFRQGDRPYILPTTIILLSTQSYTPFYPGGDFETILRQVTAHEMGHALFAGAHPTGIRNSIMGLLQENITTLDINTIRESYCSSGIRPSTPGTVSGI